MEMFGMLRFQTFIRIANPEDESSTGYTVVTGPLDRSQTLAEQYSKYGVWYEARYQKESPLVWRVADAHRPEFSVESHKL